MTYFSIITLQRATSYYDHPNDGGLTDSQNFHECDLDSLHNCSERWMQTNRTNYSDGSFEIEGFYILTPIMPFKKAHAVIDGNRWEYNPENSLWHPC